VTTAPVADQRRLLEVQALDTRTQQLDHARRTHPLRAKVAELSEQLAAARGTRAASRTRAGDLRRDVAKAEADVEQVRTRAQRDQGRLDSGQASVKDVQAITADLEALARRTEALEEIELEAMERLEAEEANVAHDEAEHDRIAAELAAAEQELAGAVAVLDDEAVQVAAQRVEKVKGIDAGLVALYERLRGQLAGLAVAPLRGRACGGCRLELNPSDLARISAAPEDQVVRCEECGRILVRGVH
jgi:predicted  nucleic acid-binding Zn-ribbon protein